MSNLKSFKVKIEQELIVTLDMDKYNDENLKMFREYHSYSEYLEDDEVIEELVLDVANSFLIDSRQDFSQMEGFITDGQKCEPENPYVYIED